MLYSRMEKMMDGKKEVLYFPSPFLKVLNVFLFLEGVIVLTFSSKKDAVGSYSPVNIRFLALVL